MSQAEYLRQWRAANPEKCAAYTKKYRAKNPGKMPEIRRQWVAANREYANEYQRRWRLAHRDKINAARRQKRVVNPGSERLSHKKWRLANPNYHRAWERNRSATNPSYRLARNLRARINSAIRERATKKVDSTLSLTGCDLNFLIGYLEAQFRPGMTWDNYGKVWEVDHRRPCASYDLTIEANQRACFRYSNLQPLFVGENRRKHAKILSDLQLQ